MSTPTASILSLSDDVLLYILKQLNNLDVLFSLIGVNRQLDRVARDVTFTRSLDLSGICSNDGEAQAILERFYSDILPRIHDRVECFTLQSRSIDRVLHAGSYPRLRRLAVLDTRYDMIATILNAHPVAVLDRISHLTIVLNNQHVIEDNPEAPVRICADLPIHWRRLTHLQLDFDNYRRCVPPLLVELPSTVYWSSTITHLEMKLARFDTCLYLLDGRLSQLHTLTVCVRRIERSTMATTNTVTDVFLSYSTLLLSSGNPLISQALLVALFRSNNGIRSADCTIDPTNVLSGNAHPRPRYFQTSVVRRRR